MTLKKLSKAEKQAMAKRCVAKLKDIVKLPKNKKEQCADKEDWYNRDKNHGFNTAIAKVRNIDLPVATVQDISKVLFDNFKYEFPVTEVAIAISEHFVILKRK